MITGRQRIDRELTLPACTRTSSSVPVGVRVIVPLEVGRRGRDHVAGGAAGRVGRVRGMRHDQQRRGGRERAGDEAGRRHAPRRARRSVLGRGLEQRRAHRLAPRVVGAVERQLLRELAQLIVVDHRAPPSGSIASRSARRASCSRRHSVPARTSSTRAASTPGTSSRSHRT